MRVSETKYFTESKIILNLFLAMLTKWTYRDPYREKNKEETTSKDLYLKLKLSKCRTTLKFLTNLKIK